jgi:xanthine dehydrogenase accessory factor
MSGWLAQARERVAQGEASVLVTVCCVAGSAPREPGSKMLVWADGQEGTVGGGNLEFVIADQARKMLASGAPHRFQSYPLGPLLGQCCGGRVGILLERLDATSAEWLGAIGEAEEQGVPYAIHTTLEDDGIAKHVANRAGVSDLRADPVRLIAANGQAIDPGAAKINVHGLNIIETVDPRPALYMFGAGHVGKALAPILATLPVRTLWFDTRLEFGKPDGPLQPAIADDLVAVANAAPAGALYLVFTQSHDLDYALTRAILARGDFTYAGLIGSATKRARFEKRLIADGIAPTMLTHLTCPIGAIGLASKAPEVLAVAIAAELLLTVQNITAAARTPKAVHAR